MKALDRPIAVVDTQRCKDNIKRMYKIAVDAGCQFRPHFKTHQSIVIGTWFKDVGVTAITVSTPEMGLYFAEDGWKDITIGFPFYSGQIDALKQLQNQSRVKLFINQVSTFEFLEENLDKPLDMYIEIDAGYGRSGIYYQDTDKIDELIKSAQNSTKINFYGFYIHDGGTYKKKGIDEVKEVVEEDFEALKTLKSRYENANLCFGDTPSCAMLNDFDELDELSPGNLVFYDLMQTEIGSNSLDQVGLLVKVPIAQILMDKDQIIIHGGAVHFSKDSIQKDGEITFGQPVYYDENNTLKEFYGSRISSLSQEHGVVSGYHQLKDYIDKNGYLLICPVHSCLTANLFDHYTTTDGKLISKRILS